MKKLLIVGLTVSLLSGCGFDQKAVNVDLESLKFKELCYDSVVYIVSMAHITKGYGFMSVKLDTEGNVEVCNKWEK